MPRTMTCNPGCALERFHEEPCRSDTGFDSSLLSEAEIDMIRPDKRNFIEQLFEPKNRANLEILTTVCNFRRSMGWGPKTAAR